MIIKYSCYKYAPETARATVNGQPVNIAGTMIPQTITTESGYFTPNGATEPETKTEQVKIDFSRVYKIRIA